MNYIILFPYSTAFYCLVLIISILLSYFASKAKGRSGQVLVFLIILILTFVAGFRGISVGIDTKRYIEVIENIYSMIGTYRIKPTEMGYVNYVIFLTSLIKSPQIVLIVSALITNALIVIRLWSFRKQISFSFSIFLYTSLYFVMTLNTMRQWISIAIIFFSIKFLFKEKYLNFILITLIASTFHTTSLIALLLIPVFIFYKSKYSQKSKKQLFLSILFSPVLITVSFLFLKTTSAVTQYDHYFRDPEFDFSLSWFFRVLLVLFIYIFIHPKNNSDKVENVDFKEKNYLYKNIDFYQIIRSITAIGLLIRSIGLFFEYTARAGLYYSFFEIVLFSFVIKSKKYGILLRLLLIAFGVLNFYLIMKDSGYGQMPYIPFWKDKVY